jgi:dynein heavy chain, axonemal
MMIRFDSFFSSSEVKSYTVVRREREEFRKKLVGLIISSEEEIARDDGSFPDAQEKEIMRYYYYIKHGIDTVHVAPLDKRVLNRVFKLIPKKLTKWNDVLESITAEMKEDYITAVKKAVIDFVLGDALTKNINKQEVSSSRQELKEMSMKWRHRFEENRLKIKRNLFAINPCLSQILEIWYTTFKGICYVDMKKIIDKKQAYDLTEFAQTVTRQAEDAKVMLQEKWFGAIQNIISRMSKKKLVPEPTKPRLLKRFYNSVAALMTQHLQDMCIRSLRAYTDYVCDVGKTNQGFRLTIMLEDEDTLSFTPPFSKFRSELLKLIDVIVKAGNSFPRIETKVYMDSQGSEEYLKPAIPNEIIEDCRVRIHEILEEERIGPELRMQDFDNYMNLMNGKNVDEIESFIKSKPSFEQYCELIEKYKAIEHEIAREVSGVVTMGFYEFHREGLIDTLESLARFMQHELITKVTADQQNAMSKMTLEYEDISAKLMATPKDTKTLMELKEYAAKTEDITIPEMENQLRSVRAFMTC